MSYLGEIKPLAQSQERLILYPVRAQNPASQPTELHLEERGLQTGDAVGSRHQTGFGNGSAHLGGKRWSSHTGPRLWQDLGRPGGDRDNPRAAVGWTWYGWNRRWSRR
jgi:hypothetical protein